MSPTPPRPWLVDIHQLATGRGGGGTPPPQLVWGAASELSIIKYILTLQFSLVQNCSLPYCGQN
jgi:hypothetical protein